jgi:hypothetical protein
MAQESDAPCAIFLTAEAEAADRLTPLILALRAPVDRPCGAVPIWR